MASFHKKDTEQIHTEIIEGGREGKMQVLDGDWLSRESLREGASLTPELFLNGQWEACTDLLKVCVLEEEVKIALQVNQAVTGFFSPISDGGTAWISQESFDVDETDTGAGLRWRNVARQLKEDVSSIILLSEADLQVNLPPPQPHSSGSAAPSPLVSMCLAIIIPLFLHFY